MTLPPILNILSGSSSSALTVSGKAITKNLCLQCRKWGFKTRGCKPLRGHPRKKAFIQCLLDFPGSAPENARGDALQNCSRRCLFCCFPPWTPPSAHASTLRSTRILESIPTSILGSTVGFFQLPTSLTGQDLKGRKGQFTGREGRLLETPKIDNPHVQQLQLMRHALCQALG